LKKRVIISVLFSGFLAFGTTALAATEEMDAGTTPDQFLYSLDQILEELQLFITVKDEKEIDLLLSFAKERLAEAKEMNAEEKEEFIKDTVEDYIDKLESAEEKISELFLSEEMEAEKINELQDEIEKATEVDEVVADKLDDETKEELEERTEVMKQLPAIVKGLSEEKVAELREQGLGFGQIAQVFILAEKSGKTVEEVAALYDGESKGFGDVAKELGFHPSELAKGKKESLEDSEEEYIEEESSVKESDGDTEVPNEGKDEKAAFAGVTKSQEAKEKAKEKAEERKREEAKEVEERKREEVQEAEERKREEVQEAEERKREEVQKAEERKREEAKEREEKEKKGKGNGNNP
jgi:hypothetical protein